MDVKTYYVENGEGFPIVLLHGNGEDSGCFDSQIYEFSKYYKVIAIDTRGHGKTPRGSKPFTIYQFAQDLLDFFNEKKIKKANLLGFSDGGNTAIIFSVLYPERVEKLILNGANLSPEGLTTQTQILDKIKYYLTLMFSKNKLKKELLELMVNQPNISPAKLSKIQAKTLVIAGTNDVVKEEHTRLIASKIHNSKLVFIEGNHYVVYNKSGEFNKKVLEFLEND